MTAADTGPRMLAGRYELHRLLGRGGAGEVWRGVDTRLGRPVAVKLVRIPPALEGPDRAETRRRVMREARAAARLDHPAAVTMYDVLDADGELCLVMELVEAPDLSRVIAEDGPLGPAEAARIALDVLDALQAAHARGLIHRDVKPSNVLVPTAGPARLTDFGTAVIAGEDRLTATGLVFGSPAYMAPEQAVDVDVGPAADMWGLGATLYHAVEGYPPFAGPTPVATMHAVLHDDPRPAVRAGALESVLGRLLVRDIDTRAGASEIRSLLQAVQASSTAVLTASAPATGIQGSAVAAAAQPMIRNAEVVTPSDESEVGWSPPRRTGAGGGRRGSTAAVVAVVAVLLLGATMLARPFGGEAGIAADEADGTPTIAGAPTVAPLVDDEVTTTTTAATPPPEVAPVVPDTPSPAAPSSAEEDGLEDGEEEGVADQGTQGDGQPAVAALPAAAVPQDWVILEPDDAPYRLSHPTDWTIERLDATRTDISDPASAAYLRLDWTDDPAPDPVADWEAYETQFAAGREGYERLRIEPTTFKGEPAALWEYRYARDGVTYHAYNLNVSNGEYGYALNYQTREEEWADLQPLFGAFAESYTIPG